MLSTSWNNQPWKDCWYGSIRSERGVAQGSFQAPVRVKFPEASKILCWACQPGRVLVSENHTLSQSTHSLDISMKISPQHVKKKVQLNYYRSTFYFIRLRTYRISGKCTRVEAYFLPFSSIFILFHCWKVFKKPPLAITLQYTQNPQFLLNSNDYSKRTIQKYKDPHSNEEGNHVSLKLREIGVFCCIIHYF